MQGESVGMHYGVHNLGFGHYAWDWDIYIS